MNLSRQLVISTKSLVFNRLSPDHVALALAAV